MAIKRELRNSPMSQGVDEKVACTVDTFEWPGTGAVTGVVAVIKDKNGTDVSGTRIAGAASVAGDVTTTPLVIAMTDGQLFRIEVQWVKSGDTWEAFRFIAGEI